MNISIFDVTGPIMIGPSSSHTAGAARLARMARIIAAKPFSRVSFALHGSFAKTYKGHGTDKALIAGVLGLAEDDERLRYAYELAREAGLDFSFSEIELPDTHENSVRITFFLENGTTCTVTGSSIGGGQILITRVNDFEIAFTATATTLIIRHKDEKGAVSDISRILADNDINIATMKLSRRAKGDVAYCVMEADNPVPEEAILQIRRLRVVQDAQVINIIPDEGDCKEQI